MTIEDKHTPLLRAIQDYAEVCVGRLQGDTTGRDVAEVYAGIEPAIQALMLEVLEATVCAVAVGDQRSMTQLYDAAEPAIQEIGALEEDRNG